MGNFSFVLSGDRSNAGIACNQTPDGQEFQFDYASRSPSSMSDKIRFLSNPL
jgi:hypothetical protein